MHEVNQTWSVRLTLVLALCLALASVMPPALVLPALSSLFTVAACASALFAALAGEPACPDHLTHWDQAGVLLLLSFITGWTADPLAAAQAMHALGTELPLAQ